MYIEPNTNIRILKNVPLDISYLNTIWFNSLDEQRGYFTLLLKYNLVEHSYQRVNLNTMRVQIKYENLYDCNYLMFQNASFGDKWFYAFITNVNYINDVTSEITYEIDSIQTWLFDFELNDCFVLREHSLTDRIGDNIIDEGLDTGEYVNIGGTTITELNDMSIVLCVTHDLSGNVVDGRIWNKVYTGFNYIVKPATQEGVNDLNSVIEYITEHYGADGIIGCVMCPTIFTTIDNLKRTFTIGKNRGTLDHNYSPRNKKLLTYPFNYLNVTNAQGQSVDYKYEYFDNTGDTIDFEYVGTCDMSPSVYLYPHTSYKGKSDNYNEGILLGNYPLCATTSDTFKAWLAQNKGRVLANSIGGIIKGAMGVATAGMITHTPSESITHSASYNERVSASARNINTPYANASAGNISASRGVNVRETNTTGGTIKGGVKALALGTIVNSVLAIGDALALKHDMEVLPPVYHGTQDGSINTVLNRQTFTFERKSITKAYAEIIDKYFDLYGYMTKSVKKPNTHSRPHWNYVKTVGCTIKGSLPKDDERIICNIFDKGITFWKNGNEIGNYSLNNSPS